MYTTIVPKIQSHEENEPVFQHQILLNPSSVSPNRLSSVDPSINYTVYIY